MPLRTGIPFPIKKKQNPFRKSGFLISIPVDRTDAGILVDSGIQVKDQGRNDGGVPAGYEDPAVVHITEFIHR